MIDDENIEGNINQPKNDSEGNETPPSSNQEEQKPEEIRAEEEKPEEIKSEEDKTETIESEEAKPEETKNEESGTQESTTEEPKPEEPGTARVKKLYRSRSNRIIFGVCGGLGEYLGIDPIIIRLFLVLSIFFGIWGVVIYIFAAFLIPESPVQDNINLEERETARKENSKIVIGSALILYGIYILLKNTGIWYYNFFGVGREIFIPAILIVLGIYLVFKFNSDLEEPSASQTVAGDQEETRKSTKKLYRSSTNKKIAGVCGGLGEYLNIDPTLIRILWIIFTFCSLGIGILIYIIFVIFIPVNNTGIVNE